MPLRICVVQMESVPGAPEANRARALDFAKRGQYTFLAVCFGRC